MIVFKRVSSAFWSTLTLLAGVGASASASAATIAGVRLGVSSTEATRIVVDLDSAPEYRVSAEKAGAGRIIVEIDGAAAAKLGAIRPTGHIEAVAATVKNGNALISFDLRRTAKVAGAFVIPPSAQNRGHRLVVDLETAGMDALLASAPPAYESIADIIEAVSLEKPPTVAAVEPPPLAEPAPLPKRVIVIDPGHGGSDPGATGQGGAVEKDVTLAAAKILSEMLEETGRYRVVMTRRDDSRLAVEERSKLARDAGAELFISLHADAIANKSVRGASVYTLSDKGAERSVNEALSKKGYKVNGLDIAEEKAGELLYVLSQRETGVESGKFADLLLTNLRGVTPLLNNSHRTENLGVLLAPDVPAVLLELAYISNASDETNLKSPNWRKRTMRAVTNAIEGYFGEKAEVRQARNGAAGN